MQINEPQGIKPKMRMYIKKWCIFVTDIKAESCKRSRPEARFWCTCIMNVCDTNYFVLFSWNRMHWTLTMACKLLRVLLLIHSQYIKSLRRTFPESFSC